MERSHLVGQVEIQVVECCREGEAAVLEDTVWDTAVVHHQVVEA